MVRKSTGSVMSGGMVISGVLLTLTVASGVVLSSSGASAEEAIIDTLNVKINSACTLSGTGTGTHNTTVNPGSYASEIGTTTLKAMCNDANGFAIYAAGYTGNTVGGANSNKLVGRNNGGTIVTGLATSGDTSNWAMKLATDSTATYPITIESAPNTSGGSTASFASYHVVPNEYTKVATRTQATDVGVSATGSILTTTYATFISAGQVGDTYDGKVIYTLVHPVSARNPGEKSLDTATTLQQVTYCSSELTVGQVYTLTDSRDNQSYKVAKLADGNCWMLENLALDPTDSTTAANMNASNTNASAEAVYNYLNGGDVPYPWSSDAVVNVTSGFYNFLNPMINNAYKDTLVTSYGLAATNGQAKVGIYYNYCAATVGTYCADVDNYGGDDATMDVCPIHWRMPDEDEFGTLRQEYSETAVESTSLQYNLSTPLSGTFYGSASRNQNTNGWWWTRTWMDERNAAALYLTATYVGYGSVGRESGATIRCLIDDN